MKKKMISILMGALSLVFVSTGCGTTHQNEETSKITSDSTQKVEGMDTIRLSDGDTDRGVSDDKQKIAEETGLEESEVQYIEDLFDPVAIVAEKEWLEILDTGEKWKDLISDVSIKTAEKAQIELVSINLESKMVTYEVSSLDMIAFLSKAADGGTSAQSVYNNLNEALKKGDIPVVTKVLILPMEINGKEVRNPYTEYNYADGAYIGEMTAEELDEIFAGIIEEINKVYETTTVETSNINMDVSRIELENLDINENITIVLDNQSQEYTLQELLASSTVIQENGRYYMDLKSAMFTNVYVIDITYYEVSESIRRTLTGYSLLNQIPLLGQIREYIGK